MLQNRRLTRLCPYSPVVPILLSYRFSYGLFTLGLSIYGPLVVESRVNAETQFSMLKVFVLVLSQLREQRLFEKMNQFYWYSGPIVTKASGGAVSLSSN